MATGVGYPDELIPLMEERLHKEPSPNYVFWQFVMEQIDFTARPGDTIRVEGPVFLTPPTNPDTARKLASLTTRVDAQTTQAFSMNKQEITLDEFIGPGDATGVHPLQLKEYDVKHSIHQLADINGGILAEDYNRWVDQIIIKRFTDNTFRSYVNSRGAVSALLTGDIFSTDVFAKVAAKLANRFIPRFPDGNYLAVIDESVQATLYQEQKFLDATTRGGYPPQDAPVFTGELGVYAGIRYLRSNNIPTVAAGSSGTPFTGSQSFVFGTSLFNLFPLGSAEGLIGAMNREAYLRGFGTGPVVKVNGMDVEVRPREVTDYGRFNEVIWIEHSKYSVLDPNPGGGKTVGVDTRFCETVYGNTTATI